jgi:hypothetical protein
MLNSNDLLHCCDCNKIFKVEELCSRNEVVCGTWMDSVSCCPFCGSEYYEEAKNED